MTTSLYQKYRPLLFADVIDQQHVKTTLQNALATDNVAHAYLFTGSPGLGKTTLARIFQRAINCEKRKAGKSEPCNSCSACQAILSNAAIDVLEIDAASHTGVENVRENIIATTRFSASSLKYKVFIIDEVHMLSLAAFNALLKTLEEPPTHVVFVLATTEIHRVPETIISRCQRFDFHKVPGEALTERLQGIVKLEKRKVEPSVLELIVRQAEGSVRDAESILGQVLSLGDGTITLAQAGLVLPPRQVEAALQWLEFLLAGNAQAAIGLLNQLVDRGSTLRYFAGEVIEVLRILLHLHAGEREALSAARLSQEHSQRLAKLQTVSNLSSVARMLEILLKKQQELRFAEIPQLPLELAAVEITQAEPTDAVPVALPPLPSGPPTTPVSPAAPPEKKSKPAAKSTPEPVVKQPAGTKQVLSLEQVRARWNDVLEALKEHNHSLASTLRQHKPSAVLADGSLEICFKYRFHEQRIKEIKNRQIIDLVLTQIYGAPLGIQTVVRDTVPEDGITQDRESTVEAVLESFGGTILD